MFLGPGQSGSELGLMAHELTHVAQQGAAGQRAPQRAVTVGDAHSPAEHQADRVATAVTGGTGRPAKLLVDDLPVGPGQMLKSQFIEQLRAQVTDAANQELGPVYSVVGCPYIDLYFGRYASQPAAAGEALLRRFAPATRSVKTAGEMIPVVVARVREGVRAWRDTGAVPAELAVAEPAVAQTAGPTQAQALRAQDGSETLASLEAELGPGAPLDGDTASRMSSALGVAVSSARIHTGPIAARKAADADALAFAVGNNVVMGARAPAVGTIEGDALLAHELAHMVQQASAASDPVARRRPIGGESPAAEDHADAAAASAVVQLYGEGRGKGGGSRLASKLGGAINTGLQLQRCPSKSEERKPKELKPEEREFQKMWGAHPHNYQADTSENTSSSDVIKDQGLSDYKDTCAIRLSTMLNATGQPITKAKAKAAGLTRDPDYSFKTKQYYILTAGEMATYLEKNFRKEDVVFPATGVYKDAAAFQDEFDKTIKPLIASRKGIAAFDKIFSFSGTGHIDLFDGERLSDAPNWYPCQRLRLWYIVVP